MKPSILVLDDFESSFVNSTEIQALRSRAELRIETQPLRGQALHQALADADIVVLMRDRTPFGEAELQVSPRLRALIYTGTRNGLLDAAACAARGIPVFNTPFGPSKAATCELTWALILAAFKRLEPAFPAARAGGAQWRAGLQYPQSLCEVLEGETLGLIGLGEIGRRVASVAKAFGMQVIAWSPNLTPDRAAAEGATAVPLDELLEVSRVVSLHLVLAASTRHVVGAPQMARMRPDSLLVNTSRSGLIDTEALVTALELGRPAMAALDVFDVEPPPAGHRLGQMPQCVLTPHLGFVARPVYDQFVSTSAEHLRRLLSDDSLFA